ncbi:MAG TPA: hypothetical protein VFG20_06565 [Planctomycetaceae bacterium]|nr:hypothetical protein [Planctomycetaceae bacterium]
MVRESRLSWNDADEQPDRRWPPEWDDDDTEDSPLEPPKRRRCNRRGKLLGREPTPRTDPGNDVSANTPAE